VIAYGADHAGGPPPGDISDLGLPARYALAIARAEPENNLETLIRCLHPPARPAARHRRQLVRTRHGRLLRAAWAGTPGLHLLEAEYDPGRLRAIREGAWLYLHGHSAGGTNPSLVEMMPFGVPILAWDCAYNRATTAGSAPGFQATRRGWPRRSNACPTARYLRLHGGRVGPRGSAQVSLGCHSRRLFRPSGPLIWPCRFPSGTPRPISGPPSQETDDAPRQDRPQDRGDRDFRRD
jgi:hypothetical protein